MKESFQKHSKNNDTSQTLGIGITKVHGIAMDSIRSVEQQHSNSHFFSIPFPFFWHFFSAKSTNPIVFRIPILLAFFSAKSANSTVFRIPILLVAEIFLSVAYHFQKTSQTSDAQKNTPTYRNSYSILPSIPSTKGTNIYFAQ